MPDPRSTPARPAVGLQLYTLRHRLEDDVEDALGCARRAGYRAVELFGGWWGRSVDGWRRSLDDHGLRAVAAHVDLETLTETRPDELVASFAAVSCDRLVVPWVAPELRRTADDYLDLGRLLDRRGYGLKARSVHLGYHNHDFELTLGEPDGLTLLVSQMSHPGMFVELDVFWAAWAGRDPVAFVRGFGRRLRMLHLKDGELAAGRLSPDEAELVPVGSGDLPMREILEAACDVGVEALFVEQDRFRGGPEGGNDERAIAESLRFVETTLEQIGAGR